MTKEQSKSAKEAQKLETNEHLKMLVTGILINTQRKRLQPVGEIGFGVSKTVPDQSMSIKEILARFARGVEVGGQRTPAYSDEDFTEFEKMDKFEKLDMAKELREEIRLERERLIKETENPPKDKATEKDAVPTDGD